MGTAKIVQYAIEREKGLIGVGLASIARDLQAKPLLLDLRQKQLAITVEDVKSPFAIRFRLLAFTPLHEGNSFNRTAIRCKIEIAQFKQIGGDIVGREIAKIVDQNDKITPIVRTEDRRAPNPGANVTNPRFLDKGRGCQRPLDCPCEAHRFKSIADWPFIVEAIGKLRGVQLLKAGAAVEDELLFEIGGNENRAA